MQQGRLLILTGPSGPWTRPTACPDKVGMSRLVPMFVSLSMEIDPPDLTVSPDREGMRQILENLVDNAIRHSHAKCIRVQGATLGSGEVKLTVGDDGRGIPAAHLERVFERFYRVDPSRSRVTGGTGLGLSIAKHRTENMKGRIWAESEVGAGTRVHLTIPLERS
jgi:signal transduction histidine kinase